MLRIRRASLILLVVFLLLATSGAQLVWRYSYQNLLAEHQAQLDRFASHIATKLDKYAHLPRLLSKDKELVDALLQPDNPAQIEVTNRYLEQVNDVIQASDSYLLDANGTTIAASNWNLDRSFLGRNFAWRPYFNIAMQGTRSQYFALGSTSGQRGYYYSYPVVYAAEIIGVVVVKMDLSAIEENWESKDSTFVATDPNQVVFMSSNPKWLFKSLITLSEAQRSTITNSRQYLDTPIRSLGLNGDLSHSPTELKNPRRGGLAGDFIVSSRPLSQLSLNIRVLSPKITLFWQSLGFVVILSLVFAIIYLVMLLIHNRQLKHRQLEQIQSEAKQKLEYLVMERTAKLHAEIDERSRTEEALRQTQAELIQAAKLAVLGQMSASISHELNNPLAAIRSFADNGRRYLNKENYPKVDDNLARIASLTERMAKISEQLKSFARKSDSSERIVTRLHPVIQSTRELLEAQLKAHQVTLEINSDDLVEVEINPIQLEQVLINLLTNSVQALEEQPQRLIRLSVNVHADCLLIHIDDNGPGLSQEQQNQLFEPFYTTKKNGLGLGLSISQQIIKAMNGQLTVSRSPLNGARFTIQLPLPIQG